MHQVSVVRVMRQNVMHGFDVSMSLGGSITLVKRTLAGFSELEPAHAARLRREILKEATACGCDAGAFGSLTALAVYLFGSVVLPILEGHASSASWMGGAVALVGGGIIGKLFGLVLARRRLARLVIELERRRAEARARVRAFDFRPHDREGKT